MSATDQSESRWSVGEVSMRQVLSSNTYYDRQKSGMAGEFRLEML